MKLNISKEKLEQVLASLTDDVENLLKTERLSKADEGAEAPAETVPEGSSAAPPAPEGNTEGDAGPAEEPAPEVSAHAEPDGDEGGDPAADQEATPEVLEAEYSKLDVEELKMHFLAAKSVLMTKLGGGAEGAPEGAPEGSPEGAPEAPPEASAGPPAMGKKEMAPSPGNGGKIAKSERDVDIAAIVARLQKAEEGLADIPKLQKSIAEKDEIIAKMEENLGKVASGFQRILKGTPMRKSAASISVVSKPGTSALEKTTEKQLDLAAMSKSEVIAKLNDVATQKHLEKKDQAAIANYCLGKVGVDSVAHIIAD